MGPGRYRQLAGEDGVLTEEDWDACARGCDRRLPCRPSIRWCTVTDSAPLNGVLYILQHHYLRSIKWCTVIYIARHQMVCYIC